MLLRLGQCGMPRPRLASFRRVSHLMVTIRHCHANRVWHVLRIETTTNNVDRGRDTHYWVPPAQNRTGGIPASNVVHHI
jgi:hypothetical protein